ncbi:MAG TPA: 2-polyprenyl-3-methyl-6-methoxy-1,4-benzoquinone monooxygenase [Gammaproteobacteria bacterium]
MSIENTPPHPDIRRLSPLDRLLIEADRALKTTTGAVAAGQLSPAGTEPPVSLPAQHRKLSEGLMRVNHTGEIAAQALYRGQALVARNNRQRTALLKAADEEQDHLAWCEARLQELNGHTSLLAPFWYSGSFLIGLAAGLAGDRWSLGFVEETENQVSAHLDDHLGRLPETDRRSRAVVEKMRADEARHAAEAREAGAAPLPAPVRKLMNRVADVMRFVSFRI